VRCVRRCVEVDHKQVAYGVALFILAGVNVHFVSNQRCGVVVSRWYAVEDGPRQGVEIKDADFIEDVSAYKCGKVR
jgi:hypothetical protein